MKKFILTILAVSSLSIGLVGCGWDRNPDVAGVNYTKAGLVGQTATEKDIVTYRKKGVVYHNGHAYHIRHGKYVIVH